METSYDKFAKWLAAVHPEVFKALYEKAKGVPLPKNTAGLGDISDWLSGVGDSLASAASAVGNFVSSPQGIATLSSLGTAYLNNQTASNVMQTQVLRAQAGQNPAPIQYVQNSAGQTVPVVGSGIAQTQLTPQILQSFTPSTFMGKYGLWIGVGAAAIVIIYLIRSR
jgi:hypothetical protein